MLLCAPSAPPLWAKLRRNADGSVAGWHSLHDHSCDVAAVTEALLALPVVADRLARVAGGSLDAVARARLAALVFLHDIGKANRGFRGRWQAGVRGAGHIAPLAWLFCHPDADGLSARLRQSLRSESWSHWLGDDASGMPLLAAVFAHHGRPWLPDSAPNARLLWQPGPDGDPIAELAAFGEALPRYFPAAFEVAAPLATAPAFHHAFAGLVMLADWLGSDASLACFPFADGAASDRMQFARGRAAPLLEAVGLGVARLRLALAPQSPRFPDIFGFAPRPLQAEPTLPNAHCLVLEAETGSGKTEAALWRFLALFRSGVVDGLYFALPTRVAATQVFQRVCAFAERAFGASRPAVVLAVPGQQMADGVRGHPLPDFGFAWDDDPPAGQDGNAHLARWAAEHPKRFLAAQISVGTIDQALLGAIAVRHAHMRGTALQRQLLVVDEVHASDRYVERLLQGLLRAHLAAGGHALLLSATLGAGMRARLLGTALPPLAAAEVVAYPALSWAEQGEQRQRPFASGRDKPIAVATAPLLDDPDAVAALALAAARNGAKVLVLRNTVGAAIATQRALERGCPQADLLFRVAGVAAPHHSRFAPEDRCRLDAAVQDALDTQRPEGGLVVAGTQTLEVSLDLDADLLLTDLCPMDVLLQRCGRLHRHAGRARAKGFEQARAVVLVPPARDLLPFGRHSRHGLGQRVYADLRIIEATWRLLDAHSEWHIPAMNRMLVERATHPDITAAIACELVASDAAWSGILQDAEGALLGQGQQAAYSLLNRECPFEDVAFGDERLATRLGAADRMLAFPPLPGPFGADIASLRVPWFLLPAGAAAAEPERLRAADSAIQFDLAGERFRYDRLGLRPD